MTHIYPAKPNSLLTNDNLLDHPIEGQTWWNEDNNHLYVYDGIEWIPLGNITDYAANWGQLSHGETIPRPINKDGYEFDYNECIWNVSPAYIEKFNYYKCFADENGTITMTYRPAGTFDLVEGVANYLIVGIRQNRNHGLYVPPQFPDPVIEPSLSATPTPTPTPTLTPTNTPTPTPTREPLPTPTASVAPLNMFLSSSNVYAQAPCQNYVVNSENVSAIVSGGVQPYSFFWEPSSPTDINASSNNTQSTRFDMAGFCSPDGSSTYRTAYYICTVTDAVGSTVSAGVDVTLVLTNNPPPTPSPSPNPIEVLFGTYQSTQSNVLPQTSVVTSITFKPDGSIVYTGTPAPDAPTRWLPFPPPLIPTTIYEIRMGSAFLSESSPGGSYTLPSSGTWFNMEVDRTWTVVRNGSGESTLTVQNLQARRRASPNSTKIIGQIVIKATVN